jgi:hypothetical protein
MKGRIVDFSVSGKTKRRRGSGNGAKLFSPLKMLQTHISSVRTSLGKPLHEEARVVHFLVDVRNVIELTGGFRMLKFFCSWALHPHMSFKPVREIMEWLDGLMEGAETNPQKALNMVNGAFGFTSLTDFKQEMLTFLCEHQLDTSLVLSRNRWVPFLQLYIARIERTPLIDTKGSLKQLDEVRIKRLDKPSTTQRPNDHFVFGIEWFFMRGGVRRLPLVNDVVF